MKEGIETPTHAGPDLWIHGDPRAGTTVLGEDGPVLVERGDLGRGDPARDIDWAWDHFTPAAGQEFRDAYGTGPREPLHRRSVHYGLIFLIHDGDGRAAACGSSDLPWHDVLSFVEGAFVDSS